MQVKYITTDTLAEITGMSKSTLESDRYKRRGFPYYRIGRAVRYRLDEVLDQINQSRIAPHGSDNTRKRQQG